MGKYTFEDKVALVTGASRGIGAATALELARHGARVVLVARDEVRLAEIAGQIQAPGFRVPGTRAPGIRAEALVLPADVSDPAQIKRCVEGAIKEWGTIDILVSNAGEYVRAPIKDLAINDIERAMDVNFYAGIHFVQAVLPVMQANGGGHIVFVTSVDGKKGLPMDAPYVSAKFALTGFAEVLRQELYGSGIYVSNVLPGRVDTKMIENLRVPIISAKIPPETVAKAVVKAIQKRKLEVILPFNARLLCYTNAILPGLADWVTNKLHLEGWEIPPEK